MPNVSLPKVSNPFGRRKLKPVMVDEARAFQMEKDGY
jgi:hypothetical protein